MNHTAEECYSKNGYPPWYKHKTDHVSNSIISGSNLECKDNKNEEHTHSTTYNRKSKSHAVHARTNGTNIENCSRLKD